MNNRLIILGILVAVIPFIGIPYGAKMFLHALLGISIAIISFRENKLSAKKAKKV